MTDGIIQQAFLPVLMTFYEQWQEDKQQDPESEYTKESNTRYHIVSKLQQELIEKIKQEFDNAIYDTRRQLIIKLIGDNKE